jgi:hypothetical protein
MKPVKLYILADTQEEYENTLALFKQLEPEWWKHEVERYLGFDLLSTEDNRGISFIDGRKASIDLSNNGYDVSFI